MPSSEQPPSDPPSTSYGWLQAGADYPDIPLSPELGRVAPCDGGLTAEQRARSGRLLAESLVISLHDHPVRFPADMTRTPGYNRSGRQHTAFAGLAASGMTVVFDNMMDGTASVTGHAPWRWDDVVTDLGMRQADIAHLLAAGGTAAPPHERVEYAVLGGNILRALQGIWV